MEPPIINLDPLLKTAGDLINSIQLDISAHGGLTSRETIRHADELRIIKSQIEKELRSATADQQT